MPTVTVMGDTQEYLCSCFRINIHVITATAPRRDPLDLQAPRLSTFHFRSFDGLEPHHSMTAATLKKHSFCFGPLQVSKFKVNH